jgi:hypothetical protein
MNEYKEKITISNGNEMMQKEHEMLNVNLDQFGQIVFIEEQRNHISFFFCSRNIQSCEKWLLLLIYTLIEPDDWR